MGRISRRWVCPVWWPQYYTGIFAFCTWCGSVGFIKLLEWFAAGRETFGMNSSISKSETIVLRHKRVQCSLQVADEILPKKEEFKDVASCSWVRRGWSGSLTGRSVVGVHWCGLWISLSWSRRSWAKRRSSQFTGWSTFLPSSMVTSCWHWLKEQDTGFKRPKWFFFICSCAFSFTGLKIFVVLFCYQLASCFALQRHHTIQTKPVWLTKLLHCQGIYLTVIKQLLPLFTILVSFRQGAVNVFGSWQNRFTLAHFF